MKLWIDGQCFQTGSSVRGIGRYVADFLCALQQDEGVELIVSLNGRMKREAVDARQYLEGILPRARIEIWYGIAGNGEFFEGYSEERQTDERILAGHINEIAPDIALSPSPFEGHGDRASPFITPELVEAVTACIYHDAIPYRYPDVYLREENARKLYMRRFDKIDQFDLVLCNSDFTRSEYIDIYGKDNAATIGAGLSETFTGWSTPGSPTPAASARNWASMLCTSVAWIGARTCPSSSTACRVCQRCSGGI